MAKFIKLVFLLIKFLLLLQLASTFNTVKSDKIIVDSTAHLSDDRNVSVLQLVTEKLTIPKRAKRENTEEPCETIDVADNITQAQMEVQETKSLASSELINTTLAETELLASRECIDNKTETINSTTNLTVTGIVFDPQSNEVKLYIRPSSNTSTDVTATETNITATNDIVAVTTSRQCNHSIHKLVNEKKTKLPWIPIDELSILTTTEKENTKESSNEMIRKDVRAKRLDDKHDDTPITSENYPSQASILDFKGKINTQNWQDVVNVYCPKFVCGKTTRDFNLNDLVDQWQIAYYDFPEKLRCFSIHISKLSSMEKALLELEYGNFSGRVNWKEIHLEIRSNTVRDRRHFLQNIKQDFGVLDNVIIVENKSAEREGETKYHVINENPDQWMLVHNLLLMRDCLDGEIAVFTRVNTRAQEETIKEALTFFGQHEMNGKMACTGRGLQPPTTNSGTVKRHCMKKAEDSF